VRAGIAVVKGLAVPVDSLKLQISHGCVRVSVRASDVMRPLRWGERLDQWGRLPHRQRRRFLTPPGYGSARRRRRPCSRPRRRGGTGGSRWWRVPTPSCSGVGKVGPEFEVPEVLGGRPAVLCCAARISANSTWTEEKSGARRSASAHCCPARRYWPCMAASMARGQCSSGSVASWEGRFPVRSQPHAICPWKTGRLPGRISRPSCRV
jgi:hypothetical protein